MGLLKHSIQMRVLLPHTGESFLEIEPLLFKCSVLRFHPLDIYINVHAVVSDAPALSKNLRCVLKIV